MEDAVTYDVILTTYEMIKAPSLKSLYTRLHFHYMVLDEGHKVKNSETHISTLVRKIHCENTLLLTGTPLQNNLVELWSLLSLMYPDVFTENSKTNFDKCFNLTEKHVDTVMLLHAQKLLDLFMIRRLKSRVEKLLPTKLETRVYCPLSKEQVFIYKALLLKDSKLLENAEQKAGDGEDADDDDESTKQKYRNLLQNLFMQLRKVSQHPYLFAGMEGDDTTVSDLVGASGKLAVLDMLLRSLFQKNHRVVLFSQFTMVLDVLEDYCMMRGWKYARFDGSTSRSKRSYLVNRFNVEDSPYFIFLMSTKAGGVGINLQTADTCILYDSDWNPQNDLQAMARVHRIGQTKKVHVYRLITSNTIEERIVERASRKLLLDQTVNRESSTATVGSDADGSGLSLKDMLRDIKFGAQAIFGGGKLQDLPTVEDIDHITNRDRTETDCFGKLKGGTEESGDIFDAEKDYSETLKFEGVDYSTMRAKAEKDVPKTLKGIGHLWQSVKELEGKKRQKKSRILMVEGKGSGYGSAHVPVLASNNYDLQKGESSVFGRELSSNLKKKAAVPKKKGPTFINADHCQVCLDGGSLVLCPMCPVSLHLKCCGLKHSKDFQRCFHHHCSGGCNKNMSEAGGLLYPCAVCYLAFCEDCIPSGKKGFRYLGANERWEALNFNSTKNFVYIHCSAECEQYAIKEFKWKPGKLSPKCPEILDVSHNFGVNAADISVDQNQVKKESPSKSQNAEASKSLDSSSDRTKKAPPVLQQVGCFQRTDSSKETVRD